MNHKRLLEREKERGTAERDDVRTVGERRRKRDNVSVPEGEKVVSTLFLSFLAVEEERDVLG